MTDDEVYTSRRIKTMNDDEFYSEMRRLAFAELEKARPGTPAFRLLYQVAWSIPYLYDHRDTFDLRFASGGSMELPIHLIREHLRQVLFDSVDSLSMLGINITPHDGAS